MVLPHRYRHAGPIPDHAVRRGRQEIRDPRSRRTGRTYCGIPKTAACSSMAICAWSTKPARAPAGSSLTSRAYERSLGVRMSSICMRAWFCPIVYNSLAAYKKLIGYVDVPPGLASLTHYKPVFSQPHNSCLTKPKNGRKTRAEAPTQGRADGVGCLRRGRDPGSRRGPETLRIPATPKALHSAA